MAAVEVRRYDGKLDSFLLRNLPQEDYERVSTSEPCVVISAEDKRVHRHVILGHRCLYLTEFPPKNLKVAVHLREVTAVKMLDDLPDFLSGKEQEDTVHVQLHCKRTVKEKSLLSVGRSPSLLKRLKTGKEQKSVPNSPLISSRTTTTGGGGTLVEVRPHSSLSFLPATAKRSPQLLNNKQQQQQQQQQQQHRSRSLSPVPFNTGVKTDQSTPPQYRSSSNSPASSARSFSLSPSSHRPSPRLRNSPRLANGGPGSSHDVRKSGTSQQTPTVRFVVGGGGDGVLKSATSVKSLSSSTDSESTSSSPDLLEPIHTVVAAKRQGFLQLPTIADQRYSSSPDVFSLSYPLSDFKDKTHSSISGSTLSLNSQSSQSCDGLKIETAVIDLYILKHTTDFYHQLYRTWMDVKISETLVGSQDGGVTLQTTKTSNRSVDQFSQLYCSLKQELLSSTDLEMSAGLAQELCTACQKYFIIKRMFWEDSELLEFCIAQMNTHLTTSSSTTSSNTGSPPHWSSSDSVEYCLILMDLVYQMMKETHLFHKKFILLTRNNGQTLLATAVTLLLLPLPRSGTTELESFERELTEKSTGVLYELIQVAQQTRWPLVRKTSVSTSWLVNSLARNDRIICFSSRMIAYVSNTISSSSPSPTTQSLVTVYHCSFLLHSLVQHSSTIVLAFKEHFSEEFRYFIRLSQAQLSLPHSKSLTRNTLELLQAAKSKII